MKAFFSILFCALLAISCTSSATKDACVKIYEEGITKIQQAKTQKEISDIGYEVAKQIVDISQGPEGETVLSSKDQMELFNAQQRFYQAIESRARQLIPAEQPQGNSEPIMRTKVK